MKLILREVLETFLKGVPQAWFLFFSQNFIIIELINYSGWRLRDIHRWSALIQNNFRSVSALFITWKSLNSADFLWHSAEHRWFLTDSELQFLVSFFMFFEIFKVTSNFEARNSYFQPNLRKEAANHFAGQSKNNHSKVWVFCYCLSNKTDLVQFFKSTLTFSRMHFREYFRKLEFLLSFYSI